jgi:hypothetical protein
MKSEVEGKNGKLTYIISSGNIWVGGWWVILIFFYICHILEFYTFKLEENII